MSTNSPGTLIAVEGIDGAGKSSLVDALGKRLHQAAYPVLVTKEPGGTPLGIELRHLLQHQVIPLAKRAECLLFMADRAQHFTDVIIPALKKGLVVISDRMSDSSIAYQSYGRGHDQEIIKMLNRWTMQDRTPDSTIYLKIPISVAYERMAKRNAQPTVFEQEKDSFMERVAQGFDATYASRTDVLTLDATQQQDQLVDAAYAHILRLLASRRV
jgi:dTMP kinase